ncbi:diaminopimelate epimerase [Glutamicibacter sp. AGC13]
MQKLTMENQFFDVPREYHFEKWVALGNDYLIIERDAAEPSMTAAEVVTFCNRHEGPGADGVLEVMRGSDNNVGSIRIINPDGSDAELSGNGTREAIMYMFRKGWTDRTEFQVSAPSGILSAHILGSDKCRVKLGDAVVRFPDLRFFELPAVHIRIGNPQTPLRVGSLTELQNIDLAQVGHAVENDPMFEGRTNVSVWTPVNEGVIRARIWERGVGLTDSSGTGATGAAIAYFLESGCRKVQVQMPGGELLVEITEGSSGNLSIDLTGTARRVYRGFWGSVTETSGTVLTR